MNYIIGNDIGNASTEIALFKNDEVVYFTQPSVISYLPTTPTGNDISEEVIMNNLLDNLTVNFFSPKVKQNGIYHIGNKSLSFSNTIRNMPIETGNKSSHDIPIIVSMSMFSAIALKDYYVEHKELPNELNINLKLATAVPSSEYTTEKAKLLENRFIQEHQVNIFVGEKSILVKVNVTHCKVTEEGKTSMLAFFNSDDSILRHYNETYNKTATPSDFTEALSLQSDIGDGTSEFVFTDGPNPVAEGSDGLRTGVGHATASAITMYRDELGGNVGDITRQHFMELLTKSNEKSRIAREMMQRGITGQAVKLIEAIEQYFATLTNSNADFFMVHGGGSIVFKDAMYNDLLDFAKQVRGEVVWIPEEFATHMNSKGTLYLAIHLFDSKE